MRFLIVSWSLVRGKIPTVKSDPYRSSIPRAAQERIVERYADGSKRKAEYRVARKLVGVRFFFETGDSQLEYGLKDGKKHGTEYDWFDPGLLISAEPFTNGLPHGTVKQWDATGRLIGTYRMVCGTGLDLWRQPRDEGKPYLSEALYWKDGHRHGFEWRIEEDQKNVFVERHWRDGRLHGIERHWNSEGRLRRGFPKYHVSGNKVTKQQYQKARVSDPTLPPFHPHENNPAREFPAEVARHLRP